MVRLKRVLFLSLFCVFSFNSVSAAVLSRDWKTPGDGLLTYDTVNKREWLDLNQTLIQQFPGSTGEERYQNVIDEIAPGGMFDGFIIANSNDVIALVESAAIDIFTHDFLVNEEKTSILIGLLGETVTSGSGRRLSVGILSEFDSSFSPPKPLAMILDHEPPGLFDLGGAGLYLTANSDAINANSAGFAIWRPAIPEPSTLLLLMVCIVFKSRNRFVV